MSNHLASTDYDLTWEVFMDGLDSNPDPMFVGSYDDCLGFIAEHSEVWPDLTMEALEDVSRKFDVV